MSLLGIGLTNAKRYEDALSVQEAELSMARRLRDSASNILHVQANLAITYDQLGRLDSALEMKRDVYSGSLKFYGAQHRRTFIPANNYAAGLVSLERFEQAKALLRKTMPVVRRVLGEGCDATLIMRLNYAKALYEDAAATLDDLRESVTTFDELERIARRVMGGAHPLTEGIENDLRNARAALRARETLPSSGSA